VQLAGGCLEGHGFLCNLISKLACKDLIFLFDWLSRSFVFCLCSVYALVHIRLGKRLAASDVSTAIPCQLYAAVLFATVQEATEN
jgi:hypothetical protein